MDIVKEFKDQIPEAALGFLVGSKEVKEELLRALSSVQDSESQRKADEVDRVDSEAQRKTNESAREEAESVRANAESQRRANEVDRVDSEAQRKANELAREEAEEARRKLLDRFGGVATPSTNPGTPTTNTFYIATEAGIYVNFNDLTLTSGENALLVWNGVAWAKELFCHGQKSVEWQSGFILPSGGNLTVTSHGDIKHAILDCTEKQEFFVKYCRCTSFVPAWCFVDKNNAVISRYDGGGAAIVNSVVVVPTGAVKVIFNSFFYTTAQGAVSYWPNNSVENFLREKLSEIETRQDGLIDEFDSISTSVEQNASIIGRKTTIKPLTSADYSGLIYDGSGFVKSNAGYNSFIIPLKEGEYFRMFTAGTVATIPNGFVFEEFPSLGEQPYVNKYYNTQLAAGFYPSAQQRFIVFNISPSSYTDGFLSYPIQASGLCKEIEILQEQGPALLGKTILCLGDSITEFKYQGKRYSDYLADITGATVINGGIGGAQMGRRVGIPASLEFEYAGQAYACLDLPSLAEAINTGDFTAQTAAANWLATNANYNNVEIINTLKAVDISKVNIVTIFIGTNDVGGVLGELGEVGNSSSTLNRSQGFQWAIQKLLTANPNLRIYYFCPMPRYFGDLREAWDDAKWCDNYETNGIKFIDMVNFQIELAKYYKIPVCDMYRTMGINQWNIKSIMNSSSGDGTHPYLGFRMIANKIASFIIANNNLNA